MLPIVAIVGRPSVGKSTLFNALTRTRAAIVADVPGVTRDRQYGYARVGRVPCVLIDTGGLVEHPRGIETQIRVQTERAIDEADRLIFVADARAGLTSQDQFIARELRRSGKPVVLALNKSEGLDADLVAADFHRLGLGEASAIAASHGAGCRDLLDRVLADVDPAGLFAVEVGEQDEAGAAAEAATAPDTAAEAAGTTDDVGDVGNAAAAAAAAQEEDRDAIRVAVIGRPNVGKSTLINRLIGEERLIASEQPGTTRDSILVPFERDGQRFVLVDTAGVRRRARVEEAIERASVARTLQAIASAHVVVMVLDAHEGIGEQDASVLGQALERGRVILIAVNKWDGIAADQREEIRRQLGLKLDFVPFAPLHFISARHGSGVGELVRDVVRGYRGSMRQMQTSELTRTLESALEAHQPPLVRGRRIKLRYAHQGGRNPPRVVIHGNQTTSVPEAYRRYLANVFRERFDLYATPVAVEFRTDVNPYDRRRPRARPAAGTMPGRQRRG
ncbi:MAG TPA: ribosome biogenesis GTPase Der [Steroidobacteraceae bacterium]|jgi:GTP-binding protein|nr:ribosome biogenesis GTPase Der [Steroidobacteraceae bacterium]